MVRDCCLIKGLRARQPGSLIAAEEELIETFKKNAFPFEKGKALKVFYRVLFSDNER